MAMSDEDAVFAGAVLGMFADGKVKGTSDAGFTTDDEPATVVCSPGPGKAVGCKQDKCGCGAIIWVSRESQELIAARGERSTRLICARCFFAEYTEYGRPDAGR